MNLKKMQHCRPLSQKRELPAHAQDPRSALEIKKSALIEAGIIVRNAQRAKPWFF